MHLAVRRMLGVGDEGDKMGLIRFPVAVFAEDDGAIGGGWLYGHNVIAHSTVLSTDI
jgi:hypothetical protein